MKDAVFLHMYNYRCYYFRSSKNYYALSKLTHENKKNMRIFLNFIVTFGGIFLAAYFFYSSTNWKELSEKYRIEEEHTCSLLLSQELVYLNKIGINRFNVGASEQGLFLSFSFIMGFIFPSILVPWNEICYEHNANNSKEGYLNFQLGRPKIASLQLSLNTIEKIHEKYGEPIFSNKLGELN